MRKDRILTSYVNWSDFELSTIAGRILKAMKDPLTEANFPDAKPNTEALELLVTDFIAKHEVASKGGSSFEISQKNESRTLLLEGLRNLSGYINSVAAGQVSLLLSTGFVLATQPSATQIPRVASRVQLRDGRINGHLRLDFSAVHSAWDYEIEVGEADAQGVIEWKQRFLSTSSKGIVLTDRLEGIRYYVRVRARNGKGTGDWSEPVSILAR